MQQHVHCPCQTVSLCMGGMQPRTPVSQDTAKLCHLEQQHSHLEGSQPLWQAVLAEGRSEVSARQPAVGGQSVLCAQRSGTPWCVRLHCQMTRLG